MLRSTDRFVIATKPHFGDCMYTIIDKVEKRRGPINMILGLPLDDGAEIASPDGAAVVLDFMRNTDGGWDTWGVSRRRDLPLTAGELAQF